MTQTIQISPREARRIALTKQGLLGNAPFGRGINATRKAIDHLGYVQLDTISVVERAHHHVLRSRVPNYTSSMLDKFLQQPRREVFEYWAHAAAYLPVTDYRFAMPVMQFFRDQKDRWPKPEAEALSMVYNRIRDEGPLMSRDFKAPEGHRGGTWWEWKPAKWALQRLFMEGHLMVSARQGFQRIYDLPERVYPESANIELPSTEEYTDFLIDRYLGAHGLGTPQMMGHLRQGMPRLITKRAQERVSEGSLVSVEIGKDSPPNYFAAPGFMDSLPARINKNVHILSPFDNTVIHRQRLLEIFNFNYQIECYVPEPKRIYGYFTLPILYGDQFVGRLDSKADRKTGTYIIKSLYIESTRLDSAFTTKLASAIIDFGNFNNCEDIVIADADPNHWQASLTEAIDQLKR